MSRTPTLPPNDKTMWRKLVARTHPDAGGDHELFIWTRAVRDIVCVSTLPAAGDREPDIYPSRRRDYTPSDDKPRVPYPVGTDFEECTRAALRIGAAGMPFGDVLSLLADCKPLERLAHEQNRGASYKRLAAIGHAWGMSKAERVAWYRVAEDIPLSDRHAGHILSRSKERAA